jgi:hypothetical protein
LELNEIREKNDFADHVDPVPSFDSDIDGILSIAALLEVLISCWSRIIESFRLVGTLTKSDHHSVSLIVMRIGNDPESKYFQGSLQQISRTRPMVNKTGKNVQKKKARINCLPIESRRKFC